MGLFVFNRPIPEPFNKGPKTIKGVSSQYGDGTDAKLCATVVKAVMTYAKMEQGSFSREWQNIFVQQSRRSQRKKLL